LVFSVFAFILVTPVSFFFIEGAVVVGVAFVAIVLTPSYLLPHNRRQTE
jgi:hypothetical protein